MKTLPKMDISDELNAQISENIKISDLCKADVVRQGESNPRFDVSRFIPLQTSALRGKSLHC
jgi:exosome complex RNA-binding protein Csl4